jgi:hypothetical protein
MMLTGFDPAPSSEKEIENHRIELELILARIMTEYSARCAAEGTPCVWEPRALDAILCDLERAMERYHVRKAAA